MNCRQGNAEKTDGEGGRLAPAGWPVQGAPRRTDSLALWGWVGVGWALPTKSLAVQDG